MDMCISGMLNARDRLASMLSAYNFARVEDRNPDRTGRQRAAYSRSGGAREGVTLKEKWALEILDGKADAGGYVAYPDGGALKMLVKVRANFMRPLLTRLFIGLGCIAVFAMIVAGCAGKALSKRVSRQQPGSADRRKLGRAGERIYRAVRARKRRFWRNRDTGRAIQRDERSRRAS